MAGKILFDGQKHYLLNKCFWARGSAVSWGHNAQVAAQLIRGGVACPHSPIAGYGPE